MAKFLDISLHRAWRLIVIRHEAREEQILGDDQLGAAIEALTREAAIQHVACEPVFNIASKLNFAFYDGRDTASSAA